MFYGIWFIIVLKGVFKKKIVMGPASFGPFKGLPTITQKMVKYTFNRFVDLILVREPYSAKFLDSLGVKNYLTVADAALLVKAKSPSLHKSSSSSKLTIGFAPALITNTLTTEEVNTYAVAHVKCIDELIKQYNVNIVFLPSSLNDIIMCKKINDQLSDKNHVTLIITDDVDEYESWIRRLDLLITSRMHPSIIAARNLIPFSVIIYDHKQIGVLQQLGLQSFSIPIGEASYDNLKALINHTINNRSKIIEILKSVLPKLQDESITVIKFSLSPTEP